MSDSAMIGGATSPAPRSRGFRLSEPVVWGVLLIAALGFAYQTWTRKPPDPAAGRSVTLWNATPEEVTQLVFEVLTTGTTVEIERRGEGNDAYLWGMMAQTAPDATTPDTTYFVGGVGGQRLWEMLAAPQSPRELGVLGENEYDWYGLNEPFARLSIRIGSETRLLQLGSEVYGAGNRYALDTTTGRLYVLPYNMLMLLVDPLNQLQERRVHTFDPNVVAWVTVRAGDTERTMNRSVGQLAGEAIWTSPGSSEPDLAFGDFIDRASRIWVERYLPNLDLTTVEPVMSIEYFAADSAMIGYLDVVSHTAEDGSTEYLFHSEQTRVPAGSYASIVEDVVRELEEIF
ncbi:MAG TPA: hypothetical protein VNZ57_13445 [Longimicrobiales bacterium]|nr:hypothetical protein [Longimicrobiales bacterium]